MTRAGEHFAAVARVPANAVFAFGNDAPAAAWVTADGTLRHTDPAHNAALGALSAPAIAASGRLAIPTAGRLVIIDIAAGGQTGIDGSWSGLTAAPDGSFAAIGAGIRNGPGMFSPVLVVSADGTIFNSTSLFTISGDPEHPPLRLFGDLDRALAVKATFLATGTCAGSCTSNDFVPIVADANADGIAFELAAGFTGPFSGWGAPCVPYRRADASLRLNSQPVGPDVVFCAR